MATRTSYPSNDIVRIPSRDLLVDNIPVLHVCYSAEIASKGFHSTSIMTSTICRPCLATCHRPCGYAQMCGDANFWLTRGVRHELMHHLTTYVRPMRLTSHDFNYFVYRVPNSWRVRVMRPCAGSK